ncbi:MAG: DUF3047 domain-containing protein [Rhodobacteraceae bacterium]|nr:DUF3047 domain-containing protein [Paracoccaceae bacterium]
MWFRPEQSVTPTPAAFSRCGRTGFFLRCLALSVSLFILAATSVRSEYLLFDDSWQGLRFPMIKQNEFQLNGRSLGIESESSVSFVFKLLPQRLWNAQNASWIWSVDQGVPPTDLTVKGGEDRNIVVYFLFLTAERARELTDPSPRALMNDEDASLLAIVWGGEQERGEIFPSPFLEDRASLVIARPAELGTYRETYQIALQYVQAFGRAPETLFAIGVGADSDDTETVIRARIEDFRLR